MYDRCVRVAECVCVSANVRVCVQCPWPVKVMRQQSQKEQNRVPTNNQAKKCSLSFPDLCLLVLDKLAITVGGSVIGRSMCVYSQRLKQSSGYAYPILDMSHHALIYIWSTYI